MAEACWMMISDAAHGLTVTIMSVASLYVAILSLLWDTAEGSTRLHCR